MADVILLSTADWDHPLWTNKQHTAVSLADQGHRVLYIDSLGVRSVRADRADGGRILRRLRRSLRPLRRVHDSIWVLSPLVLPGRTLGMTGRLNRWSLNLALFWADCCLDLRTPPALDLQSQHSLLPEAGALPSHALSLCRSDSGPARDACSGIGRG